MKDLKEALGNNRKPDITHVRKPIMNYIARACEYGSAKYERANFLRPAQLTDLDDPACVRADFERFRAYLRAAVSHIHDTLDAMERHQSNDPELTDVDGMQRAAYAEDTDAKEGCAVGASGLPHIAHAAASLMMAITQATEYDLLPADPGTPWTRPVFSKIRVWYGDQVADVPADVLGMWDGAHADLLDEQPEPTRPLSASAATQPATATPAPGKLFEQCTSHHPDERFQCALSAAHGGMCQNETKTRGWLSAKP